ncbi:hypothetical protein DFH28DRAFT_903154 [Melampsora americana]|nr:hypothetical protein DFH28DRAFT_903154 [Melampsora americana]
MKFLIFFFSIILNFSHSVYCPYMVVDDSARPIQVYQPINLHSDSPSSSDPQSGITRSINKFYSRPNTKKFKKLLHIQTENKRHLCPHLDLRYLFSYLKRPFPIIFPFMFCKHRRPPSAFARQYELCKFKAEAVHELEHGHLDTKQKVWVLAVLNHLQNYLPKVQLEPIKTDMTKEPIRYSALLLHLTRGLDLTRATQELWKSPGNIDPSLAEALSKAEIIRWITEEFDHEQSTKESNFMVETYNTLLQESSPLKDEQLNTILSRCTEYLKSHDANNLEKKFAYAVLVKYSSIYSKIRDFVNVEKSQDELFRNQYEYEGLVEEVTYLMQNWFFDKFKPTLDPLSGETIIDMKCIKHIIQSIIRARETERRLGTATSEEHKIQEDLVICLLRRCFNHIEGAQAYLEDVVQWNSNTQMFSLKMPTLTPTGNICVVCQGHIHGEEISLILHNIMPHRAHKDCVYVS